MVIVTIILTCYKQEKYIEETILSVINQKYTSWELLIGDDSTDDKCRKIISKYTKKYPDKIYARHHNPNKGIVNNIQFLLDQRSENSKYVAFLEGDDCLFQEYLQKKLEIFAKNSNIQLVYNELTTINQKGEIVNEKELHRCVENFCKKGKISYGKLISQTYYMSRSTLMVKSEMIRKYPIYSDALGYRTILSDVYFFNQIAHNEDIYGIDEPLIYYRIHDDSVTKNVQGTIIYYLEMIKYINYLFKKGFIGYNTYKNKNCKYYLLISLLAIKESFSTGICRSFIVFYTECFRLLKKKYKRWTYKIIQNFKK